MATKKFEASSTMTHVVRIELEVDEATGLPTEEALYDNEAYDLLSGLMGEDCGEVTIKEVDTDRRVDLPAHLQIGKSLPFSQIPIGRLFVSNHPHSWTPAIKLDTSKAATLGAGSGDVYASNFIEFHPDEPCILWVVQVKA